MNQQTQNHGAEACDHHLIDQFLDSESYRIEDAVLITHLDVCEPCREYLESEAGGKEVWQHATELLQPTEFDQASTAPYSAATLSDDFPKRPVAAQDVLDSLTPSEDPHHLGRLGTHEVTGVVGVGGMGVVLKAIDPSLDRVVAVKVMAPRLANNEQARQRFAREAKAAAAVLHPNVIPIHSVSSDSSVPYLVMAYVRGGSLQKRLETEGPLPLVDLLRIGSQIAAGLAAAHEQGLVHRDIKPENILLEEGVERVTITDFGLARAVDDDSVTQHGTIAGTPQYMSPEQARGQRLDQQSDLFSLGSVLYAMCTGKPPYRGDGSYGVMRKIIDEAPTPVRELNPEVPDWLAGIIEKLMSKEKTQRFASAAEVHRLMDACLSHVQQPEAITLPVEVSSLRHTSGMQHDSSFQQRFVDFFTPPGNRDLQTLSAASLPWILLLFLTTALGIFSYIYFGDDGIVGVLVGVYALSYLLFGVTRGVDSQQTSPLNQLVVRYRPALIVLALVCVVGAAMDMSFSPQRRDLPGWLTDLIAGQKQQDRPEVVQIEDEAAFDITEANVDLAERLIGRKEHLTFTKLKTLSPEVAAILAKHPANLSLPAIEQLTPDVAKALANKKESLWLQLAGLRQLSPEVARALSTAKCALGLDGIQTVTPEIARTLSQMGTLRLGLTSITPDVASELSQHAGWLSLPSLRNIDQESATALAAHQHWLSLNGLMTLTPDVAAALGKFNGETLDLNGLTSLDLPTAEKLAQAQCQNGLFLNGLTTLTPETLDVLASGKSSLSFQGLEELDFETQRALEALSEQFRKDRKFLLVRDQENIKLVATKGQPDSEIINLLKQWHELAADSEKADLLAQQIGVLHNKLMNQFKPNTERQRQVLSRLAVGSWPLLSESMSKPLAQTIADLTKPYAAIRVFDRLAEAGRPTEPLGWDVQATHALALARAGNTDQALQENQKLLKKIQINLEKGRLPDLELEFLGTTRTQKSLLQQTFLQKALILAMAGKTAESVDASTAAGYVEVVKQTPDDQVAIQSLLLMLANAHVSVTSSDKDLTADEIVRQLTNKHGNLVQKLQRLLGEAAGIPSAEWQKFAADPKNSTDAIQGEPLSLALWNLNPLQESIKNLMVLEDFQFIGGVPKPKQLSDAMFPSHVNGYYSMIQPHYISGLTYDVQAGPLKSATLRGNFRFQAPKLYAGKVSFVVQVDADADLVVTEFRLPNYDIRLIRGEDGLWNRAGTEKNSEASAGDTAQDRNNARGESAKDR